RPRAVEQVLTHRKMREEERILSHVAHFPLFERNPRAVDAPQDHPRARLDAGHRIEESRLSAAARADKAHRIRFDGFSDLQRKPRPAPLPDLEFELHRSISSRRAYQRSSARATTTEARQTRREVPISPAIRPSPPGLSSSA